MTGDDNYAPREEFTNIAVHSNGDWFTDSKKIINPNVLDYFQNNLHRDQKGVYIFNRFGKFSEKGYVTVKGPVMNVIDLRDNNFILKGDRVISYSQANLILSSDLIPFLRMADLGCLAAIPSHIGARLAEDFQEDTSERFFFLGKELKIEQPIQWYTETHE